MPSFSREVFKQLNLPPHFSLSDQKGDVLQASRPWEILPPSHRIGTPQPLFKELTVEEVQRYKDNFAGSQPDRLAARRFANRTLRRPVEASIYLRLERLASRLVRQ